MMKEKRKQCEKVFYPLVRKLEEMSKTDSMEQMNQLYRKSASCIVRYAASDKAFCYAKWILYDKSGIKIVADLTTGALKAYVNELLIDLTTMSEDCFDMIYDYIWELWEIEKKRRKFPQNRFLDFGEIDLKT